jgi:hypothetical protein
MLSTKVLAHEFSEEDLMCINDTKLSEVYKQFLCHSSTQRPNFATAMYIGGG